MAFDRTPMVSMTPSPMISTRTITVNEMAQQNKLTSKNRIPLFQQSTVIKFPVYLLKSRRLVAFKKLDETAKSTLACQGASSHSWCSQLTSCSLQQQYQGLKYNLTRVKVTHRSRTELPRFLEKNKSQNLLSDPNRREKTCLL